MGGIARRRLGQVVVDVDEAELADCAESGAESNNRKRDETRITCTGCPSKLEGGKTSRPSSCCCDPFLVLPPAPCHPTPRTRKTLPPPHPIRSPSALLPSPESDEIEAEKVEELRAILVRSESDEMPGLHTLALNVSCVVVALRTALIDLGCECSRSGELRL